MTNQNNEIFQEYKREAEGLRGCALTVIIGLITLITGSLVFIISKEYKDNKRHTNVISLINEKDNKIIITDVNSLEERTVDYTDFIRKSADTLHQIPAFKDQIHNSNLGDTVKFISPDYKDRRQFTISHKNRNRLLLNLDSIRARIIRAEKSNQRH